MLALVTADPGEPSFEIAAVQEFADHFRDGRAKGAKIGLILPTSTIWIGPSSSPTEPGVDSFHQCDQPNRLLIGQYTNEDLPMTFSWEKSPQ